MKKLLFLLLYTNSILAQVGIGTTTPDTSSSLDISSTNSGLLIPRVSLVDINNGTTPINAPATSLLVYNTNAAITGGNGMGHYYWNGAQWTKLQTNSDEKWTRDSNINAIFPSSLTDNVGIGTITPQEPLTVKSNTYSNLATFDGTNQMYITFAENGINRGYIGSYFGNPEDVNFGNYGGTNGSVHLTTSNQARVTATNSGNVGIGITNPTEKLDIAGKIKITDGTEGVGRVLTSNATGVASWTTTTATKFPVFGSFGAGATFLTTTTTGLYTTATITLPPGKWAVSASILLNGDQVLISGPPFFLLSPRLSVGNSIWMRTYFSDSPVSSTGTTDYIPGSSSLISGNITGPEYFSMINGTVFIDNQSGGNKPYYLWAGYENMGTTLPANFQISGFGGVWAENQIIAIPMN